MKFLLPLAGLAVIAAFTGCAPGYYPGGPVYGRAYYGGYGGPGYYRDYRGHYDGDRYGDYHGHDHGDYRGNYRSDHHDSHGSDNHTTYAGKGHGGSDSHNRKVVKPRSSHDDTRQ